MKLIVLGASVMAGAELNSQDLIWPAQYAASQGLIYENYSLSGCSTQHVLRILYSSVLKQTEPCFYVIHWPTAIRYEYVDKKDDSWIQISPISDNNLVHKVYYGEINSYLGDKWNTLLMIFSAQQAMIKNNHKFAMTVDDDFLYETQWHNPDYVEFLQNHTRDSILWFEGNTWSKWAKQKDFPHGIHNHPLEPAHYAAFKLFEPIYNNILKGMQ
jgi:hypothetical protein